MGLKEKFKRGCKEIGGKLSEEGTECRVASKEGLFTLLSFNPPTDTATVATGSFLKTVNNSQSLITGVDEISIRDKSMMISNDRGEIVGIGTAEKFEELDKHFTNVFKRRSPILQE